MVRVKTGFLYMKSVGWALIEVGVCFIFSTDQILRRGRVEMGDRPRVQIPVDKKISTPNLGVPSWTSESYEFFSIFSLCVFLFYSLWYVSSFVCCYNFTRILLPYMHYDKTEVSKNLKEVLKNKVENWVSGIDSSLSRWRM